MKIIGLVSVAIAFVSAVSGAKIPVLTPTGEKVPDSLLKYLDCPIGDVLCKSSKTNACQSSESLKICEGGNPTILGEILSDKGIEIGDNTPDEFCRIHADVCNMIENYNPPLTKNYIFDTDYYLDCDDSDRQCKYGKYATCRLVFKMCWGNYPRASCRKLLTICDEIGSDEEFEDIKLNLKTFEQQL